MPTFKTKDEYLAWVAAWKEQYARLTQAIRAAKAERKTGETPYWRAQAQRNAHIGRCNARKALEARKEAKALSWQMKQAALAAK